MNNVFRPFFLNLAVAFFALSCPPVVTASPAVADNPLSYTFVLRAQAMEGANLARSLMNCVADEYAYGLFNTCHAEGILGNYVERVQLDNGRIDIVYGGQANRALAGHTLSLTPYRTRDDHVVWRCGNRPGPSGLYTLWSKYTVFKRSTLEERIAAAVCDAVDNFPNQAAYRRDVLRERIGQGIRLAGEARRYVERAATSRESLFAAATTYNALNSGLGASSSFVTATQIDLTTGSITVIFNPVTMGIAENRNTLVLTPFLISGGAQVSLAQALQSGQSGPINWACTSTINAVAAAGTKDSSIGCELMGGFAETPALTPTEVIRGYISQGLQLAEQAKRVVEESSSSYELLVTASNTFNAQGMGLGLYSQYVTSVLIDPTIGAITITYNGSNVGILSGQDTLVLTPFLSTDTGLVTLDVALGYDLSGPVAWACASATSMTATNSMLNPAQLGTLLPIYAPLDCI